MPPASRRKPKKTNKKKFRTLTNSTTTTTNHHSSPAFQLQQGHCDHKPLKEEQGYFAPNCLSSPYVVVEAAFTSNHHSRMEGSCNGSLEEETHKVESLSEDKRVVVEVAADGDIAITDHEHDGEDVSESDDDPFDPDVSSSANEFTFNDAMKDDEVVELELEEDEEKGFVSHEPEWTNAVSSQVVANHGMLDLEEAENEASRESEVVETFIKDVKASEEEEKSVLSSIVITDVVSKVSDESEKVPPTIVITEEIPKGIEKSLVPFKVEDVQDQSYESAKESFQTLANVPDAESNNVTMQNETEVASSTENQNIVYVTQRQYTSWRSCCGIFEILRRGDR